MLYIPLIKLYKYTRIECLLIRKCIKFNPMKNLIKKSNKKYT